MPDLPMILTIDETQWAELMGKYDALIQAVKGINISIQPTDIQALIQAVKDVSDLSVVLDRGHYREELFGRFQEG